MFANSMTNCQLLLQTVSCCCMLIVTRWRHRTHLSLAYWIFSRIVSSILTLAENNCKCWRENTFDRLWKFSSNSAIAFVQVNVSWYSGVENQIDHTNTYSVCDVKISKVSFGLSIPHIHTHTHTHSLHNVVVLSNTAIHHTQQYSLLQFDWFSYIPKCHWFSHHFRYYSIQINQQ